MFARAGLRSGSAWPSRSLTRKLLIACARALADSAERLVDGGLPLPLDSRPRLAEQDRADGQDDHRRLEQPGPDGDPGSVLACPSGQPHRGRGAVDRDRLVGRPPLDVVGEAPTGTVAVLEPRCHCLEADRIERRVDGGVTLPGARELAAPDLAKHLADVTLERRLACQDAIEGGAEAVDIRSLPEAIEVAGGLLGAHVGGSAQGTAGQGLGAAAGRAGHESALAVVD